MVWYIYGVCGCRVNYLEKRVYSIQRLSIVESTISCNSTLCASPFVFFAWSSMFFLFPLLSPWLMSSLYLLKSRRIHSKLLGATIAGVPHQNHGGWWRQGNSSARLKRISIKRYCLYASRILQERFPPTI